MQEDDHADRHMVRADLLMGFVLLVLGVAVTWMSWDMPRLTTRGIHPATAPGLVPGLLGISLTICGVILAGRSLRARGDKAGWAAFGRLFISNEATRAGSALALAAIYALVLVGWLPFWAATAIFVFAFILLFERGFAVSPHPIWRTTLTSAVQAVIVAIVVTLVFERGFLVRLP
jgi:putative tricarboxylic transport membrane protein